MPVKQKIDSLVIVIVAVTFQWFFMFTKHDPGLRPIIPFGEDPYDALGSFASIVNIFLCLLLLWRTFRAYGRQARSPIEIQYLRRTQAAVALSILVTLAADAVAMVRHPHMWIATTSQNKLLALVAGMTVVSGGALWLILSSTPRPIAPRRRGALNSCGFVTAIFLVTLAFYPERLISRLSTHLMTVLIGDLLLFAAVSAFLLFLFPDPEAPSGSQEEKRRATRLVWTSATFAGLTIGMWLFLAEMSEGGGPVPPLRLRLIVASVYIGLTLAGMLLAVAFLRRPLGLSR